MSQRELSITIALGVIALAGALLSSLIPGLFHQYQWYVFYGCLFIIVACSIFIGWAFIATRRKEHLPVDKKKLGDITVSMGDANQVGHIGHVVNEAPLPDIQFVGAPTVHKNGDGTYTASFMFDVVAPYTPGQLYLKVSSIGITEMDVVAQRAGISMTGHTGTRDGFCFITLMQPYGRYAVTLRSRELGVHVEYVFS